MFNRKFFEINVMFVRSIYKFRAHIPIVLNHYFWSYIKKRKLILFKSNMLWKIKEIFQRVNKSIKRA